MGIKDLVIVKLGGSLITNKDVPQSPNIRNMKLVSREISKAISIDKTLRLILIHGGGSYGHFFAKKFDIGTTKSRNAQPEGLALTAAAMIKLHSLMLDELNGAGVYCGTIFPIEILSRNGADVSMAGEYRIGSIMENRLIPITFGNVSFEGGTSYITSGDKITLALARKYRVKRAIFAMDVDGVYRSADLTGSIIRELGNDQQITSTLRNFDVTGGLQAKIATGLELSKIGTEVVFVNGTKKNRLSRVLMGDSNIPSTKIYSLNEGKKKLIRTDDRLLS